MQTFIRRKFQSIKEFIQSLSSNAMHLKTKINLILSESRRKVLEFIFKPQICEQNIRKSERINEL